ncbi:lytic transglycosylase domain-containing protein [Streptomyces sp. NPDC058953]|uniref:lytic transglycosylase domain-containing protein n=1 Tax=unclassified Streptomyces TaxID=2593676 RepID=UPI0036CE9845
MGARFGRRLRRGATTTAVAAAAVAALSASQAPGVTQAISGDSQSTPDELSDGVTPPPGTPVSGDSPYYTDLPPLKSPTPTGSNGAPGPAGQAESGIPATVLAAYKRAEETIATSDPGCKVPWQLLAAIGKVESGQARGGRVDANGTTISPIRGPVLNGVGFANIPDTDDGAYDGDTVYDRAVGPMQFIPSTWATWGQDANGDGRKDPNNIYDAALAAGRYLCANDRDLTQPRDLERAILGYNRSREYLNTVLSWFEYYKRGTHTVPDGTGVLPGTGTPDSNRGSGSGSAGGTGGTGGGGSTTPPTTEPGPPQKPGPGQNPSPGGGTNKPPQRPKPQVPPTLPPLNPAPVGSIVNAGTGPLTVMAGRDAEERVTVRVRSGVGRPVAGQEVRFDISGLTGTVFAGGKKTVTLRTAADGTVTAPVIEAGDRTGAFTVRAAVVGHTVSPITFAGKVTQRAADKAVWTDGKDMTAAPGAEFAHTVVVKATYRDTDAPEVAARVVVEEATADGTWVPAETGPYFKGADEAPVRTLDGLTTDSKGLLTLPKLHADDRTGTFRLRVELVGGAVAHIDLEVAASIAPTPSSSATGTAG